MLSYIKSDIELKTTTLHGLDYKERIDGFYFRSKRPLTRSYQWHATIGLENTYQILKAIQESIRDGEKALKISISSSMGDEMVYIWKGSLKKAEKQMLEMINKIQKQY